MNIIQLLRELIRKGSPYDENGSCSYCTASKWGIQTHDPDCVWKEAKAWLSKNDGT